MVQFVEIHASRLDSSDCRCRFYHQYHYLLRWLAKSIIIINCHKSYTHTTTTTTKSEIFSWTFGQLVLFFCQFFNLYPFFIDTKINIIYNCIILITSAVFQSFQDDHIKIPSHRSYCLRYLFNFTYFIIKLCICRARSLQQIVAFT